MCGEAWRRAVLICRSRIGRRGPVPLLPRSALPSPTDPIARANSTDSISSAALPRWSDRAASRWRTAQVTAVETLGFAVSNLTAAGDWLLAIGGQTLIRIDPHDGTARLMFRWTGPLTWVGGLAVCDDGSFLSMLTDGEKTHFARIDPAADRIELIRETRFAPLKATSAWDDELYGVTAAGELIRIDVGTANATRIAAIRPSLPWSGLCILTRPGDLRAAAPPVDNSPMEQTAVEQRGRAIVKADRFSPPVD